MVEVGTWTNASRLNINHIGVQQMTSIRKHLQVVTREVINLQNFFFLIFFI